MAASPLSPPLMTFASVSMRYLLFGLSPLWHFTQDFSRIGLMSFAKVRPVLLAAGGNLLASHFAFFFSVSAARSATADKHSAVAASALAIFRKPCGMQLMFMIRLFMADIFNLRPQRRQKDLSKLRTGQGELFLRVAGRGIFAQIHAGKGALRSESMFFGALHSDGVLIRNVPKDHLSRTLGDQRFNQEDARVGRSCHKRTEIERLGAGANEAVAGK